MADYYPTESVDERPSGDLLVTLRVSDPTWVRQLVLGSGGNARVVEPGWLAERGARRGRGRTRGVPRRCGRRYARAVIVAAILVAGALLGLVALGILAYELYGHVRRFRNSLAGVQTGLVLPINALADAVAQAQHARAVTADDSALTAPDTVAGAKTTATPTATPTAMVSSEASSTALALPRAPIADRLTA